MGDKHLLQMQKLGLNESQIARCVRELLAVRRSSLVWVPSSGVFLEPLHSKFYFMLALIYKQMALHSVTTKQTE